MLIFPMSPLHIYERLTVPPTGMWFNSIGDSELTDLSLVILRG